MQCCSAKVSGYAPNPRSRDPRAKTRALFGANTLLATVCSIVLAMVALLPRITLSRMPGCVH